MLLVFTSVLLGGCSKLWQTIECFDTSGDQYYGKYTKTVVWETNKRVLSEYSFWGFSLHDRSDWNNRWNCSITKEEEPPTMLPWYEYASWHFK